MTAKVVPINKNAIGPIENGVPLPKGGRGVHGESKYPHTELKVGQSFTVPIAMEKNIRSLAHHHGYATGKKFATRTEGDRLRVWRVK